MKLYFHPMSTTSRTVMLFCTEANISIEPVVVDLMTGEHMKEPFVSLNPNAQVPVLADNDFVLTECSAILKYLADKVESPAYPRDLMKRARVNERIYDPQDTVEQTCPENRRNDAAQKNRPARKHRQHGSIQQAHQKRREQMNDDGQ